MRVWRLVSLAGVVALAGCHQGTKHVAPTESAALLGDLQTQLEHIQKPAQAGSYDLRQPARVNDLQVALKPYDSLLDEADGFTGLTEWKEPLGAATDFGADPSLKAKSAAARAREITAKNLCHLLSVRAQVEYSSGHPEKGIRDLTAVHQLLSFQRDAPGSTVDLLVLAASQASVSHAVRAILEDIPLDQKQAAALADLVGDTGDPPNVARVAKAEFDAEKGNKSDSAQKRKQSQKELEAIETAAKAKTARQTLFSFLRREAGNVPISADPKQLGKSEYALFYVTYGYSLRAIAVARMAAVELKILAEKDRTGKFPKALPSTVKEVDPFSPGGARFTYTLTASGFRLEAPGSRGVFKNGAVSVEYPQEPHPSAVL